MKLTIYKSISLPGISLIVLYCLLHTNVFAHDASNLDDFAVDQTNNKILINILHIQEVLTDYFQHRNDTDVWPSQEIIELRDELKHLQEDAEMSLDYLAINGININQTEALKKNPLAGRTVSASQAMNTSIALLNHTISIENRDAFTKEIIAGGLAAHMFNLLTVIKDKMELYGELMKCSLNPDLSTYPIE